MAAIGPFSLNIFKPCLPFIKADFDAPIEVVQLGLTLGVRPTRPQAHRLGHRVAVSPEQRPRSRCAQRGGPGRRPDRPGRHQLRSHDRHPRGRARRTPQRRTGHRARPPGYSALRRTSHRSGLGGAPSHTVRARKMGLGGGGVVVGPPLHSSDPSSKPTYTTPSFRPTGSCVRVWPESS